METDSFSERHENVFYTLINDKCFTGMHSLCFMPFWHIFIQTYALLAYIYSPIYLVTSSPLLWPIQDFPGPPCIIFPLLWQIQHFLMLSYNMSSGSPCFGGNRVTLGHVLYIVFFGWYRIFLGHVLCTYNFPYVLAHAWVLVPHCSLVSFWVYIIVLG